MGQTPFSRSLRNASVFGPPKSRSRGTNWDYLYQTSDWKRRRLDQLFLEPNCRMCQVRGLEIKATIADHIAPHRGNIQQFYSGRLQSLCTECHSIAKRWQEQQWVQGRKGLWLARADTKAERELRKQQQALPPTAA
jgi:hypothetical protein